MNKGALDNNVKEEGGTKKITHQHQMKPNLAKYSKKSTLQ